VFTWYIFIQSDDVSELLSLRMDMHGQIDQPLQMRPIAAIQTLQANARTIIVLPAHWCGLYQIELPLLAERKAREAIPFALEDMIAKPVAQVHFAFDKNFYRNGRYLVVVIDKTVMTQWMAKLEDIDLNYDQITLDWFALQPGEGMVDIQSVKVNAEAFQGTVTLDIWERIDHAWSQQIEWTLFSDSAVLPEWSTVPKQSTQRLVWVAQRLFKGKMFNLCQGNFQHATSHTQIVRKYQFAGILASAWLVAFIGIHLGLYWFVTHQTQKIDQQIAQSYRVFFPGATQVISPKIRVAQLLQQSQLGNNAALWSLLESFSLAAVQASSKIAQPNVKMESMVQTLQFQNQVLTVLFHCENFAALEQIESFLQHRHIHVQQISAATEADKVVAKLELSL
jgi:general secretion pathway protein L